MRLSCSLALISVSLSLLWTAVFAGEHQYPEDFSCSLCVDFIQEVIVDREEDPLGFCHRLNVCDYLTLHMGSLQQLTEDLAIRSSTPQELCTERRMCPHASLKEEVLSTSDDADAFWKRSGWSGTVPSATETNLRVTKAMGPVGYNVVRLSIIDHKNVPRPDKFLDFFREGGYAAPFRYRWTDKYLYSKLVSVDPDAGTTLDLWDGAELQIPPLKGRGQPTRGLAVADPCFSSTWVACKWGASYKVLDRLSTALNIASQEPEGFDFWMILGDMFYDRFPGSVDQFFDKLDPRVRVTPFVAVLGNHDIWVRGHPLLKSRADQFGNGFMQYFAMDTVASWNATSVERGSPFDFRVDPDREYTIFHEHHEIAAVQNFVSYFTVGNVGMFSFSGGHTWEETRPYAEDACRYFMRTQPTLVLLLSHWDGNNDGSYADMIGSEMYKHFHSFPGCQLRMPVHYVVGHTHCNQVLDNGVGFMVGGQGMSGCSDFGIPIFETTRDDRFEVLYYPLESEHGSREDVWSCILRHGFGGCKSMATVWYNATLTEQNAQI